jgi:hypothetical protein
MYLPCSSFLEDLQEEITENMRAILIDWLIDVHKKFKLRDNTLYIAINIIDRYLSRKKIARRSLQLLGVTSMLIASKLEDIYPPKINDFVYITDNVIFPSRRLTSKIKCWTWNKASSSVSTSSSAPHLPLLIFTDTQGSTGRKKRCSFWPGI